MIFRIWIEELHVLWADMNITKMSYILFCNFTFLTGGRYQKSEHWNIFGCPSFSFLTFGRRIIVGQGLASLFHSSRQESQEEALAPPQKPKTGILCSQLQYDHLELSKSKRFLYSNQPTKVDSNTCPDFVYIYHLCFRSNLSSYQSFQSPREGHKV